MTYLATTFSPQMLGLGVTANVKRIEFSDAKAALADGFTSAVSHEVTAKILTSLLGKDVAFNRINLSLEKGDRVVSVVPNFRAEVAREFTPEEIGTNFSCFLVDLQ